MIPHTQLTAESWDTGNGLVTFINKKHMREASDNSTPMEMNAIQLNDMRYSEKVHKKTITVHHNIYPVANV